MAERLRQPATPGSAHLAVASPSRETPFSASCAALLGSAPPSRGPGDCPIHCGPDFLRKDSSPSRAYHELRGKREWSRGHLPRAEEWKNDFSVGGSGRTRPSASRADIKGLTRCRQSLSGPVRPDPLFLGLEVSLDGAL